MKPFSKSSPSLFLLLVLVIACSTLLQFTEARAKSGIFDSNEDEGEDWWGSDNNEEETKVEPKSGDEVDHSSHHNHQDTVQTAGSPGVQSSGVQSSWDQGGGYGGGNLAAFNESCGNKPCAPGHELQCSSSDGSGRCICTPHHTYIRQTEKCWLIAKQDRNECEHDAQCHAGAWGPLSRCNKHNRQCECYDYSSGGKRNVTQIDGVCYLKKYITELCRSDEECDKTIEGDAFCKAEDGRIVGQNYNGTCQCRDTHMFWKATESCLKLSTKIDDPCIITEQCKTGSLGRYSRCSPENATCECYSSHPNATEVVYYERLQKCFRRKEYNETCENADECRASLGPDVECGPTEEFPNESVCYCPKGKVCRSSAFSTMFAAPSYMTTLGIAFTAAAIGVSNALR